MLSTTNKTLDKVDWTPGIGFFSAWVHIGMGLEQVASGIQKAKEVAKQQLLLHPSEPKVLQNRTIKQLDKQCQEGWKHIHRGLVALLLPIIGNLFLMIYDLVALKKKLPPSPLETPPAKQKSEPRPLPSSPSLPEKQASYEEVVNAFQAEKFKTAFNKCRDSIEVVRFLENIKDVSLYKYLAEYITLQEIESYTHKWQNFFGITEYQYLKTDNDWLVHFFKELPEDKLCLFMLNTTKRDDLGYHFFSRLLNIASCLPVEKQALMHKILIDCTQSDPRFYDYLINLNSHDGAHCTFALAYMNQLTNGPAWLYKQNPFLCAFIITHYTTSKQAKDWLEMKQAAVCKDLMLQTSPVETYLLIRNQPAEECKQFLSCLGRPLFDETMFKKKFSPVADIMTSDDIEKYATKENNCFHIQTGYFNGPDERLETLLKCFSINKQQVLIKTTMARDDVSTIFILRMMFISSKLPNNLLLFKAIFDGLEKGDNQCKLGDIPACAEGAEILTWRDFVTQAYEAFLQIVLVKKQPYMSLAPFYHIQLCESAFSNLKKTSKGILFDKLCKLHLKCGAHYKSDAQIDIEYAGQDWKKLKTLFDSQTNFEELKKRLALFHPEDIEAMMLPHHDTLRLYEYINDGQAQKFALKLVALEKYLLIDAVVEGIKVNETASKKFFAPSLEINNWSFYQQLLFYLDNNTISQYLTNSIQHHFSLDQHNGDNMPIGTSL